ncbi:MAG: DUF2950 family protein, partial [Candidatus Binataceae bacterium]
MPNVIINLREAIAKAGRLLLITTLLALCLVDGRYAWAKSATAQQTFDSPEAAVKALGTAIKTDDMDALGSILGSDAEPILSSGDPVADKNARDNFSAKYQEMHRIAY